MLIAGTCACLSGSAFGNDFEQLQGTWKIISRKDSQGIVERDGAFFIVSGQQVKWIDGRPGIQSELTITILRPKSAPKHIDLLYSYIATDGNVYSDSLLGIYEFTSAGLILCIARPENVVDDNYRRPTNFTGDELGEGVRLVLQRVSKEEKSDTKRGTNGSCVKKVGGAAKRGRGAQRERRLRRRKRRFAGDRAVGTAIADRLP